MGLQITAVVTAKITLILVCTDWSSDSDTEANAAIIIDEAEKLYNTVVKDSINKIIIVDYPFCKSSSLPLLPASTEEQQKSYEIKSNNTT